MTCENLVSCWEGREQDQEQTCSRRENRKCPRFSYPVRASVEVPFLPTSDYGVCDFSESGMFLAFTDAGATKLALEQNSVEAGTNVTIRFTFSLSGTKHQRRLQARLVRVAHHGIGIEFTPGKPWQIVALIEFLDRAGAESKQPD